MWFLHRNAILTKDNLAKQNFHGSTKCYLCYQGETIQPYL
jgi:hypothetical protein